MAAFAPFTVVTSIADVPSVAESRAGMENWLPFWSWIFRLPSSSGFVF